MKTLEKNEKNMAKIMGVYLKIAHISVDNNPRLQNFCTKLMPRDGILTKLYDVRFS